MNKEEIKEILKENLTIEAYKWIDGIEITLYFNNEAISNAFVSIERKD